MGKGKQKRFINEWVKAIGWAFLITLLIRAFVFQSAFIPSSSMENTLLPGDFILINKVSVGARIPITPLSIPFFHGNFPLTEKPTYLNWIRLPYLRLPGFRNIRRNEILIFNNPAEVNIPVDKRTYIIKRCVAIPGDTLTISAKNIIIGKALVKDEAAIKYLWRIKSPEALSEKWLDSVGIYEGGLINDNHDYEFAISSSQVETIQKQQPELRLKQVMDSAGHFSPYIFPNSPSFPFNSDFWGPVVIPAKDFSVEINLRNIVLYEKIIRDFERNKLEIKNDSILINGEHHKQYRFKMNYYFVMGDNRDQSADSRFWGFLPEDHIIGVAWVTIFSYDSSKSLFKKIRWNRFLKTIN